MISTISNKCGDHNPYFHRMSDLFQYTGNYPLYSILSNKFLEAKLMNYKQGKYSVTQVWREYNYYQQSVYLQGKPQGDWNTSKQ